MKKMAGELTDEEETSFRAWYEADEEHRRYFERATRAWEEAGTDAAPDVEQAIARFDRARRERAPRRFMPRASRAAAVLLLLGAGGAAWWWTGETRSEEEPAPLAVQKPTSPGGPRARLELAGGRSVELESTTDSAWTESGVTIHREAGSVSYHETQAGEQPVAHALIIPRGGEYHLVLADNSHVWLNSDSRLDYPSSFAGGEERVVTLSGEAYFEVTPGDKPFIVRTSRADVRVHGTSFNVLAYEEDETHDVTLLTGRVSVAAGGREYPLAPGQQAVVGTRDVETRNVDARLYCSWYKGALLFEGERLEEIMTRLARWYDVRVTFVNDRARGLHFTGDLERYANLEDVLRLVAMTTRVEFELKNNEVFVR